MTPYQLFVHGLSVIQLILVYHANDPPVSLYSVLRASQMTTSDVGRIVGSRVGANDGTGEGNNEGINVGSGVGKADGEGDGRAVGESDG